jgi:hypothetical protein
MKLYLKFEVTVHDVTYLGMLLLHLIQRLASAVLAIKSPARS